MALIGLITNPSLSLSLHSPHHSLGRKMKITLVTEKPINVQPAPVANRPRKPIGNRISNQNGRSRTNGNDANRSRPAGGNRPQANKTKRAPATKEQLDADLDAYINKVGDLLVWIYLCGSTLSTCVTNTDCVVQLVQNQKLIFPFSLPLQN